MVVINATPKSTTANSFITLAAADAYLATHRLYSTAWSSVTDDDTRSTALIWATSILDASYDWYGFISLYEQILGWPRAGIWTKEGQYVNQDVIPVFLEHATAELAMALLTSDRTVLPEIFGKGFKEATVGPLRVVLDPQQVIPLIPPLIKLFLEPYGTLRGAASFAGAKISNLSRA